MPSKLDRQLAEARERCFKAPLVRAGGILRNVIELADGTAIGLSINR